MLAGDGGEHVLPLINVFALAGGVLDQSIDVIGRAVLEAAAERLKEMAERRLDDRDYLIVCVDGIRVGGHHLLAALGVDDHGKKRILGLRESASENAIVALALLESIVERGMGPREGASVRPRRH